MEYELYCLQVKKKKKVNIMLSKWDMTELRYPPVPTEICEHHATQVGYVDNTLP